MGKPKSGKNKRRNPTPKASVRKRFVAVHTSAAETLGKWQEDKHNRKIVSKVQALIQAFEVGEPVVVQLLRNLAVEPVRGSDGLLELGPKQKRGGAPRVFLLRYKKAEVFVAAGMEHGTKGASVMGIAIGRATTAKRVLDSCSSTEAMQRLGKDYAIEELQRNDG